MATTPLATLDCACANVRRASRLVTNLYNKEMAETGMESTQFTLLMSLHQAGEIKQGSLAELLGIDSTSLTRGLRPLIKDGLIQERPGADRRQKFLSLTTAGKKKYQTHLPKWQRAQDKLKKALSQSGWNKLFASSQETAQAALDIAEAV